MKNKEILDKSLKKARENGFIWKYWDHWYFDLGNDGGIESKIYLSKIFSHDFAKAFWGNKKIFAKEIMNYNCIEDETEAWQYHLQQMVLCEEPLKYLEKFL